jgi:hypothetical protein
MSRKLTAILLAMVVLAGAMCLKTVVTAHSNGVVMMANGGAPFPPSANGGAPFPPSANGGAPFPPSANGGAPFPPSAR